MATIKIGSNVTEVESSQNSFGKAPALSIDNSAGNFSTVDSTADTFTGTDPFVSLSGDGSNVTIKVSGLQKDGAAVATNAEVVAADSNAKVYWKDNEAYGADDLTAFKALFESSDNIAIRLNADISTTKAEAIVVPAGKTLTLDLNGHTLASTGADAIANKGTLTIKGAGKVTTSAKSSAAVATYPDSVTVLNGGDYTSGSWYVIKNTGTMTIDGDVNVLGTEGNVSSLIDNGWYGSTDTIGGEKVPAQAGKASLHIVNGQFDGVGGDKSMSTLKNDDYGVCVIDDGNFNSLNNQGRDPAQFDPEDVKTWASATTVMNANLMTINGGTFIGSYNVSTGCWGVEADQGLTTVNGGTFKATYDSNLGYMNGTAVGVLTINGGDWDKRVALDDAEGKYTIVVSGGTFVNDVTEYLGEGASISQVDGKYVVTK